MPRINVTPAERKSIPLWLQTRYELGQVSKEELDQYISGYNKEYTKQYNEFLQKPEVQEAYKQEAVQNDINSASSVGEPGIIEASKRLQILSNEIQGKYNDLYAGFTATDQARYQQQPSGSAVARGLAVPVKQKSDGEYSQEVLKGLTLIEKTTPELQKLQQEAAGLEKYLQEKGPVGITALNDAAKSWKSVLSTAGGWVGKIGGAAVGSIPAVDVFSGGTVNPITGAAAGSALGSGLGAIPITMDMRRQSYVDVRMAGGDPKDAEEFSNYMTGAEYATEALGGMVPGGGAARGLIKNSFKEWLKLTGKEATKNYLEEASADLAQKAIAAGTVAANNSASKYALEQLPSSFSESISQTNRAGIAGAIMGGAVSSVPAIKEISSKKAEVGARVSKAQELYKQFQGSLKGEELLRARNQIAATFELDADQIATPEEIASSLRQKEIDRATRAAAVESAVNEVKMTGVQAFDLGQMSNVQTIQGKKAKVTATGIQQEPFKPQGLQETFSTPATGTSDSFKKLESALKQETKVLQAETLPKPKKRLDTTKLSRPGAPVTTQPKMEFAETILPTLTAGTTVSETTPVQIKQPSLRVARPKVTKATATVNYTRTPVIDPATGTDVFSKSVPKMLKEVEKIASGKGRSVNTAKIRESANLAVDIVAMQAQKTGALKDLSPEQRDKYIARETAKLLKDNDAESLNTLRGTELTEKRSRDKAEAKELSKYANSIRQGDQAAKSLASVVGQKQADKLIASGQVAFTPELDKYVPADRKEEARKAGAMYLDGKVFFNTDSQEKMKPALVRSLAYHEFGHRMQDDSSPSVLFNSVAGDARGQMFDTVQKDVEAGDKRAVKAAQRAREATTSDEEYRAELPAYYLEEVAKDYSTPLTGAGRLFVRTAVTRVKEFLKSKGFDVNLSSRDLVSLVDRKVKNTERSNPVRRIPHTKVDTKTRTTSTKDEEEVLKGGRVRSFTTAKGSTYEVMDDGTTVRTKAARNTPGHEGDYGKKPRTEKTVYVKGNASVLSAAGVTNLGPQGARVIIYDNGRLASLLTWNIKDNRWGISPSEKDIEIFNTPQIGYSPLELWKKTDDIEGFEAYRGMHAGNKIISIDHGPRFSLGTAGTSGYLQAVKEGRVFTDPVSGKRVFDISDTGVTLDMKKLKTGPKRAEEVLKHPALFKNWPFLKDVMIKSEDIPQTATSERLGYYDARQSPAIVVVYDKASPDRAAMAVLHEMTHAIQEKLGWEGGTNPEFAQKRIMDLLFKQAGKEAFGKKLSNLLETNQKVRDKFDALFDTVYQTRKMYEANDIPWPKDKIYQAIKDPQALQAMMPLLSQLGANVKEAYQAYEIIRKAADLKYWVYMMNSGEVQARAVTHVFDGNFSDLKTALEATSQQGTGVLDTDQQILDFVNTAEKSTKGRRQPLFSKRTTKEKIVARVQPTIDRVFAETIQDKVAIALETRSNFVTYTKSQMVGLLEDLHKASRATNTSEKDIDDAWTESYTTGNRPYTGVQQVDAVLEKMRSLIDMMSMKIVDVHNELGIPLSDRLKGTIGANIGKYITKSYEVNYDKQWGEKLKLEVKAGNKEANRVMKGLEGFIFDNYIDKINRLNQLDEAELKKLNTYLFGKAEGSQQDMRDRVRKFVGSRGIDSMVSDITDSLLRITKDQPLLSYYQGAARNTGILQRRTRMDPRLQEAIGLRTGVEETAITTSIKMARLLAETEYQADLIKRLPDKFSKEATDTLSRRIPDESEYGVLAGMYTDSGMYDMIKAQAQERKNEDVLIFDPASPEAMELIKNKALNYVLGALRIAAVPARWMVKAKPYNYILNVVGSLQNAMKASGLWAAYGTDYTTKDGTKVSLADYMKAALSGLAQESYVTRKFSRGFRKENPAKEVWEYFVKTGLAGTAYGEDVSVGFRESLKDSITNSQSYKRLIGADASEKAVKPVIRTLKEANALLNFMFSAAEVMSNVPTMVAEANYVRKLWTAEGREFTHDDLMKEAADRAKRMSINRDRASVIAKATDRYAGTTFLTFFTETLRAPIRQLVDGIREATSPSPNEKVAALKKKHGSLKAASALVGLSLSTVLLKALASQMGHKFGEEDDEDKTLLREDMQASVEDLIVLGKDKDGNKRIYDSSMLDTYGMLTGIVSDALQGNTTDVAQRAMSMAFVNPLIADFWKDAQSLGPIKPKNEDLSVWVTNTMTEDFGHTPDPSTVASVTNKLSLLAPNWIEPGIENPFDSEEAKLGWTLEALGASTMSYSAPQAFGYSVTNAYKKISDADQELKQAIKGEGYTRESIRGLLEKYELTQYDAVKDLLSQTRAAVKGGVKVSDVYQTLSLGMAPANIKKAVKNYIATGVYRMPPPLGKNYLQQSERQAKLAKPNEAEEIGERYQQNTEILIDEYRKMMEARRNAL